MNLKLLETFTVHGHQNIFSSHKSTFEFTKDLHLSTRGDCIIGIGSSIAPLDFKTETKELLKSGARFEIFFQAGDLIERIKGKGHPMLALTHPSDMVFRKSDFISDRTVLIRCDKSAQEIDRDLIALMRIPNTIMEVNLYFVDNAPT